MVKNPYLMGWAPLLAHDAAVKRGARLRWPSRRWLDAEGCYRRKRISYGVWT